MLLPLVVVLAVMPANAQLRGNVLHERCAIVSTDGDTRYAIAVCRELRWHESWDAPQIGTRACISVATPTSRVSGCGDVPAEAFRDAVTAADFDVTVPVAGGGTLSATGALATDGSVPYHRRMSRLDYAGVPPLFFAGVSANENTGTSARTIGIVVRSSREDVTSGTIPDGSPGVLRGGSHVDFGWFPF